MEKLKYMDVKTIAILILTLVVLFMIFFKGTPIKSTFDYEKLHLENDSLVKANSILKKQKDSIDIHIKYLEDLADGKVKDINKSTDKINNLNKNKDEISNYVDTLPNDSIATAFTKYLERRKS